MSVDDAPVVVDFVVGKDAMVWPMVAAGTSNDDIKVARDTAPDFEYEMGEVAPQGGGVE
jgi:acetolactate synthase I/II/III large subunit